MITYEYKTDGNVIKIIKAAKSFTIVPAKTARNKGPNTQALILEDFGPI